MRRVRQLWKNGTRMTYACLDMSSRRTSSGLHSLRGFLALAALVLPMLVTANAHGQMTDLHPTSVEIAQLPTFCWGQMGVPNASGPEFGSFENCGPGMNHYCAGLVHLVRSKRQPNKAARLGELGAADAEVRYTEKAIAGYPNCSVRENVAGARAQIDSLLTIYGSKRPKAQ